MAARDAAVDRGQRRTDVRRSLTTDIWRSRLSGHDEERREVPATAHRWETWEDATGGAGGSAPPRVRVVRLRGPAGFALAVALVALGGIFLAFGLVLLATLGVAGAIAGGGWLLWRRVTGRGPLLGAPPVAAPRRALDPRDEVGRIEPRE
jgi:hypothetical protein